MTSSAWPMLMCSRVAISINLAFIFSSRVRILMLPPHLKGYRRVIIPSSFAQFVMGMNSAWRRIRTTFYISAFAASMATSRWWWSISLIQIVAFLSLAKRLVILPVVLRKVRRHFRGDFCFGNPPSNSKWIFGKVSYFLVFVCSKNKWENIF